MEVLGEKVGMKDIPAFDLPASQLSSLEQSSETSPSSFVTMEEYDSPGALHYEKTRNDHAPDQSVTPQAPIDLSRYITREEHEKAMNDLREEFNLRRHQAQEAGEAVSDHCILQTFFQNAISLHFAKYKNSFCENL